MTTDNTANGPQQPTSGGTPDPTQHVPAASTPVGEQPTQQLPADQMMQQAQAQPMQAPAAGAAPQQVPMTPQPAVAAAGTPAVTPASMEQTAPMPAMPGVPQGPPPGGPAAPNGPGVDPSGSDGKRTWRQPVAIAAASALAAVLLFGGGLATGYALKPDLDTAIAGAGLSDLPSAPDSGSQPDRQAPDGGRSGSEDDSGSSTDEDSSGSSGSSWVDEVGARAVVHGQITTIDGTTLTIDVDGSTFTVLTDDSTSFRSRSARSLTDLSVGDSVLVVGALSADDTIDANAVILDPTSSRTGRTREDEEGTDGASLT